MNVSKPDYQKLYLASAMLSWLLLVFADNTNTETFSNDFFVLVAEYARITFLNLFIISVFLFYKLTIGKFEGEGFNDLLWKSFVTGLIVTLATTANNGFVELLIAEPNSLFSSYRLISNHVLIAMTVIFVANNFFAFKKMILYQKSKEIANLWRVYEYLVYISLLVNYLKLINNEVLFALSAIPMAVMGVILAINIKWIAYLNFRQKWKGIIFLTSLLIFNLEFITTIFAQSTAYSPITDLANNLFVLSLVAFICFYSFFSLLVLLFNLPTSSVFEQKFGEVLNLQKLSKSAQMGKNEEEVYELLIDSCASTFVASAAALEIFDSTNNPKKIIYRSLDKDRFYQIKTYLRKNNLKIESDYLVVEDFNKTKYTENVDIFSYKSLLAIPLVSYGEKQGIVYLLSELKNGFEREMIEVAGTYVNQASVSISNFRLISQAVENARYKEELEIAKRVQSKLLPQQLVQNELIHMTAFTESPDEVGGDYYDYSKISTTQYAVVIGDVSGKGTSAAFHMAKMKGIFHSLIQMNFSTDEFLHYANNAVSSSLERSSFVTFTILIIDLLNKTVETSRAGHCPTLYFNKKSGQARYIDQKGMGLGIIRNQHYKSYIDKQTIQIDKGDLLLVFTDGIVEACNEADEEFGYERIQRFVQDNYYLHPEEFKIKFLGTLRKFCSSVKIDDDYTFLLIKIP